MQLVITLRKEVADRDEGNALLEWVIAALVDHPDVAISGHVTNHFVGYIPPEPPG